MQHLEVSCAVRRIYKSLGFKGLKDSSLVLAAGIGPEINSRGCLSVLLRPCRIAMC